MELKAVYKKTFIVIVPLSLISALLEPVKLPLGIFLGGVLALLNLRGLKRGVENLIGTERPTVKLVFMSMFRLLLLGAVITLLAASRAVNLLGLLVGFTVVFALVMVEGLRMAK
jgi:hypothetical protein